MEHALRKHHDHSLEDELDDGHVRPSTVAVANIVRKLEDVSIHRQEFGKLQTSASLSRTLSRGGGSAKGATRRTYGGGLAPPIDFDTPDKWYKQRNLHHKLRPVSGGDPPRLFSADRVLLSRGSSRASIFDRTQRHILKQQEAAKHRGELELNSHRHRGKELDSIVLHTTFKAAKREVADHIRQSRRFHVQLQSASKPAGARLRPGSGEFFGAEARKPGFEPVAERWRTTVDGVDTEVVSYVCSIVCCFVVGGAATKGLKRN